MKKVAYIACFPWFFQVLPPFLDAFPMPSSCVLSVLLPQERLKSKIMGQMMLDAENLRLTTSKTTILNGE